MRESRTQWYEQVVPAQVRNLATTVCAVPPRTPVPTCPEWDVADLTHHVGQTYAFFASLIEDRVADPTELRSPEEDLPAEQDEWPSWLDAMAARLVAAVEVAGPDAPIWNPTGESSGGAEFWLRRAFGETVAHRADATAAAGVSYELDTELGQNAITEFLEMVMTPTWAANMPEAAAGMQGDGQTLWWAATDAGADTTTQPPHWLITRTPKGPVLERQRPDNESADVAVAGPASSLLRLVIRRLPIDEAGAQGVSISGDRALLTDWVALMKY